MGKTDQVVVLKDGRQLGYAEYGVDTGAPVFYFHAAASSRLEQLFGLQELLAKNVRLVCIDRPGYGLSSFQAGRRLLYWPDDVRQLANHLGLDRFYVIGYSNGGPYVLGCCHQIPNRIIAAAVVSSPAPSDRPGAFRGMPIPNRILNGSARWLPGLTKLLRRLMMKMVAEDVEKTARQLMSSIPEQDKEILLKNEDLIENMARSVREGFRMGWQGAAQDDSVVFQDWGFAITDITIPLNIWHGQLDVNVPYHAGEYLHAQIKSSRLIPMPDEGHFLMAKHADHVLNTLLETRP